MAPLRIKPVGPSDSGEPGICSISLLWSCFVLCVFFIVKRLRNTLNMPRIERLNLYPSLGRQAGEDVFDDNDPLDATDRQLLTELLGPFLRAGPRKSSLINSGYLAANAKMATAKGQVAHTMTVDQLKMWELEREDTTRHSTAEHQDLRWSRRSSPGPQARGSTFQSTITKEYNGVDQPIRSSSLHNDSKVDDVRQFCDDHNPAIKWKRRTLVFDKTP